MEFIGVVLYLAIFSGIGIFVKFSVHRYRRKVVLREIEEARLAHLKYHLK